MNWITQLRLRHNRNTVVMSFPCIFLGYQCVLCGAHVYVSRKQLTETLIILASFIGQTALIITCLQASKPELIFMNSVTGSHKHHGSRLPNASNLILCRPSAVTSPILEGLPPGHHAGPVRRCFQGWPQFWRFRAR